MPIVRVNWSIPSVWPYVDCLALVATHHGPLVYSNAKRILPIERWHLLATFCWPKRVFDNLTISKTDWKLFRVPNSPFRQCKFVSPSFRCWCKRLCLYCYRMPNGSIRRGCWWDYLGRPFYGQADRLINHRRTIPIRAGNCVGSTMTELAVVACLNREKEIAFFFWSFRCKLFPFQK